MNNFSKEYIKECDCEEIQNLRGDEWEMGDFMYYKSSGEIDVMHPKLDNGSPIWLPLEGQLTEEILKRCYTYNLNLECFSEHHCKKPNCQKWGISIEADNHVVNHEFNREVWNEDILIAKIRILKELLK